MTLHFHPCPECYRYELCEEGCSMESDLGTHLGVPCGTHVVCSYCQCPDESVAQGMRLLCALGEAVAVVAPIAAHVEAAVLAERERCARLCDGEIAYHQKLEMAAQMDMVATAHGISADVVLDLAARIRGGEE